MKEKVYNVVNGPSIYHSMKDSKILNNIIEFDAIFSMSDLSNINNYEIKIPKEILYYGDNDKYLFNDCIKKINECIDHNYKIIIWTSHYDIESYMLFLYICNYLKNKNCNLYVTYSDEYDENYPSPSCMNTDQLETLSTLEHKLSKDEINRNSEEFNRILNTKCDFRIIENKKVKCVSFDYYNDEILNMLKDYKEVKISFLTANFMSNHYLKDLIVVYLINRLINDNKIKITKKSSERYFSNLITLNI